MRAVAAAGVGLVAVVATVTALATTVPVNATAQETSSAPAADGGTVAAAEPDRPPGPREALSTVLDDLVRERILTSGQAEEIVERIRARLAGIRDRIQQGRLARQVAGRLFANARAVLIELTGLTRTEFVAAWQPGDGLGEVAADAGVTRDEFTQALIDAAEEKVAVLLDEDRITANQAERLSGGIERRAGAIANRIWDRSRGDAWRAPAQDDVGADL